MNKIISSITKTTNKVILSLKKNSPEILIVSGIVGIVSSAVMACVATTKVSSVLEETKERTDSVHKKLENDTLGKQYTVEDSKKELTNIYIQTGIKFVKLYSPAVILGALSISGIVASNNIMKKRNASMAAAYAALESSFIGYRKRVSEKYGDDAEKDIRYNATTKEVLETIINAETGEETSTKKTVTVVDPNLADKDYAFYFDNNSTGFMNNIDYNKMFVEAEESFANNRLHSRGYLTLNEVRERLGLAPTQEGQFVGWIDKGNGDGFVDFRIKVVFRDTDHGPEEVLLLDPNVDGGIIQYFNKKGSF